MWKQAKVSTGIRDVWLWGEKTGYLLDSSRERVKVALRARRRDDPVTLEELAKGTRLEVRVGDQSDTPGAGSSWCLARCWSAVSRTSGFVSRLSTLTTSSS
jgi:hypothetical protein